MDAEQFTQMADRVARLELSTARVSSEVAQVKADVAHVQSEVSDVKSDVSDVKSDTGELLDIFRATKTGFKVVGGLGTAFKWISGIIVSAAALWATFKSGGGGS